MSVIDSRMILKFFGILFIITALLLVTRNFLVCTEMNRVMQSISVVYVTVPSIEIGKKIAREVIEKKLAACVNIVPQMTSVYEWQGKIEEENESMMIIKTKTDILEQLKETVVKLHPYDVPEFISLPVEYGSEPYIKWVKNQVKTNE